MAEFQSILPELTQGLSARREQWEPIIRLFVSDDALMCQCGVGKPWRCALSWDEITATDWQLFQGATALPMAKEKLDSPAPVSHISAGGLPRLLSKARARCAPTLSFFRSK